MNKPSIKFASSRVIKTKTKKVVLTTIKEIFIAMGVSKIQQSDKESLKILYKKYWCKVNVRQIFGCPYHSQSQGTLKAYNTTIQGFLYQQRMHQKRFDLNDFINEFLVYYNERVHSTTWYATREITERAKIVSLFKRLKRIQPRVEGSRTTKMKRIK